MTETPVWMSDEEYLILVSVMGSDVVYSATRAYRTTRTRTRTREQVLSTPSAGCPTDSSGSTDDQG